MRAVKVELPREMEEAEIHIFSDLHLGDPHCDLVRVQERINYIANHPNAFAILNGDICNNAIKSGKSDTYSDSSPMSQLELACNLFSPIKDRILCATNGNHEARTAREDGIDLSAIIAQQLGVSDRYCASGVVLFVKIGERRLHNSKRVPIVYSFYVSHGTNGGGRREGGKINRLADMASIVDTDIYVMGHTHMPAILKECFFRTDPYNCQVFKAEKLFVNSSAMLDYGGYGEEGGYKPSSKDCPVIFINGKLKLFNAIL